mgnify:CR=1 FL=1
MISIRGASFRRVLEQDGGRYAEVAVATEDSSYPRLLAHFRKEGGGRYQLIKVLLPPAEEAAPGRSSHAEDVTFLLFAGPNRGGTEDRAGFGRRVLEQGDVRSELDRHLNEEA